TTEDVVFRPAVVVPQHESGVAWQYNVQTGKDIRERIVVRHRRTGTETGHSHRLQRAGERVYLALGKVQGTVAERRTKGGHAAALELRVDEEERPVSDNRSTEREPVLILIEVLNVI